MGETQEGTYEDALALEFPPLSQICIDAIGKADEASAQVWCFGETSPHGVARMKSWMGRELHCSPMLVNTQFFIFPLDDMKREGIRSWPGYQNEYSLHIFLTKCKGCSWDARLQEIYETVEVTPKQANEKFLAVVRQCGTRSGIKAILIEIPLVIVPGGSHPHYPTFHSIAYSVAEIVSWLEEESQQNGYDFESMENQGEKYLEFFRQREVIIV